MRATGERIIGGAHHRLSSAPVRRTAREVDDHHGDRDRRQRRGERDVVGAEVPEHHVADHLRGAADDVDADVVAEAEREREDAAGDDRGLEQRHHDAEERAPRLRAEVARRLEHRVRQPLEPGVDRDDHVRQPQVAERDDRGGQPIARACGRTPRGRCRSARASPATRRPSPGSSPRGASARARASSRRARSRRRPSPG